MKKKRTFIGIIGVIFILLVIIFVVRYRIAHKSIPDYNENLQLSGLKQPVKVYRDTFAIPHIYAENEKDLYTAVGYLMAQDRLWQMDLLRRATTGKLSEIFGKDLIKTDMLMRSLKITNKSHKVLDHTPQKIKTALRAFSDGVNQYIEKNRNQLPPEFSILKYKPKPWKPIHSINLIGYMSWDLTMPWSYEMALHKLSSALNTEKYKSLIPDISNQKSVVYPEFESDTIVSSMLENLLAQQEKLENLGLKIFSGSNNWAVSGKKTTSGKPILANDMHLGLSSPGVWQQMHMVVKDSLNVTGVVLPGQPFVISGHNDSIAWGLTNVMLDDMDFYKETIHPEDSSMYKLNGTWKKLKIEHENIPLKNGDTAKRTIKFTHRGPIISQYKGIQEEAISMRWIGNEYSNELRSTYLLNHAANWDDFKNAVKTFISISQNIVYADVNGNIGLYCCAGIPIRKGNGISIYPGDTTKYDWKGFVPFEQLPHTYNPESGIVASANNKTVGDDYPYYISHWFDLPSRINRIRELLEEKEKLNIEDFKRIQTDQNSYMAERLKPKLIKHLDQARNSFSETEKQALSQLKKWDALYSKESVAALIFEQFYIEIAKSLANDEFGDTLITRFLNHDILVRNLINKTFQDRDNNWIDNVTTDKKESFNDLIISSFQSAVKSLKDKHGDKINQWSWGKVHTLSLKHPLGRKKILDRIFQLNRGPFQVGGSYHTVCPYSYSLGHPYKANHGASHRQIYNLANWDNSWSIIPTGNSGIPASKHYCDQTDLYISKKYHKDYFSKDKCIQTSKYKMTFQPKK
jgi:penicillin amidase